MIRGVGVDIVEIKRFYGLSARLVDRLFTQKEQEYMEGKKMETRAGLFAAKEAVVKALGIGFRGFWPAAVEVLPDRWGRPQVEFHGKALAWAKELNVSVCHVSISHGGDYAIAYGIAEGDVKIEDSIIGTNGSN